MTPAEPDPSRGPAPARTEPQTRAEHQHPPTSMARLVERLRHRDAAVRASAARDLGRLGDAARGAISPLLAAAVDVESEVRSAALAALERIDPHWPAGSAAVEGMPFVIRALGSQFTEVWQVAIVLVTRIGGSAVPPLVAALSDATSDARIVMCVRALGRIGPPAVGSVPVLAHTLANDKDHIRREAAEAPAAIGSVAEPAAAALAFALADRAVGVRIACARALGRIGSAAGVAVPALISLAADPVERVRAAAVEALVAIGPVTVPALMDVVAARDHRRVRAALHRVAEVSDRWKRPLDPNFDLDPQRAVRNIGWFFQETADAAERVELAHEGAVKVLGRLGSAAGAAVPTISAALADGSRTVRTSAAEALGRIGPPAREACAALTRALTDGTETVRKNAAAALPKVDPAWASGPEACRVMGSWVEDLRSCGDPGRAAAEAFRLAGAAGIPSLVPALESPDRVAREAAANLLGALGPTAAPAAPALTRALDDAHGWVREAAAKALRSIEPPRSG